MQAYNPSIVGDRLEDQAQTRQFSNSVFQNKNEMVRM